MSLYLTTRLVSAKDKGKLQRKNTNAINRTHNTTYRSCNQIIQIKKMHNTFSAKTVSVSVRTLCIHYPIVFTIGFQLSSQAGR